MTTEQQKNLSKDTYQLFMQRLSELSPNLQVAKVNNDPKFIPKETCKHVMRIRVMPIKKLPRKFWGTNGCFYEIGVGPYSSLAGKSSSYCLGGVQFFQYADQKNYGNGEYKGNIKLILETLLKTAPKGFRLSTPEIDGKFHFEKRYAASEYKNVLFPCEQAAQDLAWLVANSLPLFMALPSKVKYETKKIFESTKSSKCYRHVPVAMELCIEAFKATLPSIKEVNVREHKGDVHVVFNDKRFSFYCDNNDFVTLASELYRLNLMREKNRVRQRKFHTV